MYTVDDLLDAYEKGIEHGMKYNDESLGYVQPCCYCSIFEKDRQYLISNGDGDYTDIYFAYCPICGRKFPPMDN